MVTYSYDNKEETAKEMEHDVIEGYDKNDWDHEDRGDTADEYCE